MKTKFPMANAKSYIIGLNVSKMDFTDMNTHEKHIKKMLIDGKYEHTLVFKPGSNGNGRQKEERSQDLRLRALQQLSINWKNHPLVKKYGVDNFHVILTDIPETKLVDAVGIGLVGKAINGVANTGMGKLSEKGREQFVIIHQKTGKENHFKSVPQFMRQTGINSSNVTKTHGKEYRAIRKALEKNIDFELNGFVLHFIAA
jgi:hypothetical protein